MNDHMSMTTPMKWLIILFFFQCCTYEPGFSTWQHSTEIFTPILTAHQARGMQIADNYIWENRIEFICILFMHLSDLTRLHVCTFLFFLLLFRMALLTVTLTKTVLR